MTKNSILGLTFCALALNGCAAPTPDERAAAGFARYATRYEVGIMIGDEHNAVTIKSNRPVPNSPAWIANILKVDDDHQNGEQIMASDINDHGGNIWTVGIPNKLIKKHGGVVLELWMPGMPVKFHYWVDGKSDIRRVRLGRGRVLLIEIEKLEKKSKSL